MQPAVRSLALLATLSLVTTGITPAPAHAAEEFPNKPIKIVMPFGPGGSPDTFGRMTARLLSARIGQQVVVENRPGANSTVGSAQVAKSRPDGYTILYGTNSGTSAARSMFKSLPYDPIKDLSGIIINQEGFYILLARLEEKGGLAEYVANARKNPERYPMGGSSSTSEILNKMFLNATKLDYTYVRYKESSGMFPDIMAGRLAGAFQPVNIALSFMRPGKMRGLAVSSAERLAVVPDMQTVHELYPGVVLSTWTGYFAPGGTPLPIRNILWKHFADITLQDKDVNTWASNAGRALTMKPEEVDAYVRKDEARWNMLTKMAGIEPE